MSGDVVGALLNAALTLLECEAAHDRGLPPEHPIEVARRDLVVAIRACEADR